MQAPASNPYWVLNFNDPDRKKRPHFKDLSNDEDDATKQIKAERRRLIRQFHPDKAPAGLPDSDRQKREAKTIQIDAAFQAIKTEAMRREHRSKRSAMMQDPHYKEFFSMLDGYHGMVWVCFSLSALFLALLPLVLVLQIDGTFGDLAWSIALIPFWLFDLVMLIAVLYIFCSLHSLQPGNVMCAIVFLVFWLAVIGFEAMFCVHEHYAGKEDAPKFLTNSFVYLGPLIVAISSCFVLISFLAWQHVQEIVSCSSIISGMLAGWLRLAIWSQCAIAQTVMIALKINGKLDSKDWVTVFIPTMVLFGGTLLLHLLFCCVLFVDFMSCCNRKQELNKASSLEEGAFIQPTAEAQRAHQQQAGVVCGKCVFGFCEFFCIAASAAFFGLLVLKLSKMEKDERSMDASVVAAPILAITFLLCCCFSIATLVFVSAAGDQTRPKYR